MFRRFVHTLLGALAGYLLGASVSMTVFSLVYGYRAVNILEESNRNRWAFVAASACAVIGGLVGWWRSYSDVSDSGGNDMGDDE